MFVQNEMLTSELQSVSEQLAGISDEKITVVRSCCYMTSYVSIESINEQLSRRI